LCNVTKLGFQSVIDINAGIDLDIDIDIDINANIDLEIAVISFDLHCRTNFG